MAVSFSSPGLSPAARWRGGAAGGAAAGRRPENCEGLEIFSFVGDAPPVTIESYKFEGQSRRTDFTVVMPAETAPGAQVWIIARWFSPRGATGPISDPVSTRIAGGVSEAA